MALPKKKATQKHLKWLLLTSRHEAWHGFFKVTLGFSKTLSIKKFTESHKSDERYCWKGGIAVTVEPNSKWWPCSSSNQNDYICGIILWIHLVLGLWGATGSSLNYDWEMLGGFDLHQIELDCRRKYGQGRSQHWPYKQFSATPHHRHLLFHCVTSKVNDLPPRSTAWTVDIRFQLTRSGMMKWYFDLNCPVFWGRFPQPY